MLAIDYEIDWDDAFAAEVRRLRLWTFADVANGRGPNRKKKRKKRRRGKAKSAKRKRRHS